MKKVSLTFLAALAASVSAPAMAQDAGDIQIKVLGTAVLPDGEIDEVELVDDLRLIPGTVTAKAHFDVGGVKPYVGAGVACFMFFGEDEGSDLVGLGVTDADLSNEFGFALQAGFDIPIEEAGFGVSVDVKRYFIGTDATFRVGDDEIIRTKHNLDPWTISAGLTFIL